MKKPDTIDMTPTWEEVAGMYVRFAESGEQRVCRNMSSEIIRAGAMADVLKALLPTLNDDQAALVGRMLSK